MKISVKSRFDLSDPVQYAQFRYFEDIGKLILETNTKYETEIKIEEYEFSYSRQFHLDEINFNRYEIKGFNDANPTDYIILDLVFKTK